VVGVIVSKNIERFERDLDVFVPEGTILTAVMNYSIFIWVEVK